MSKNVCSLCVKNFLVLECIYDSDERGLTYYQKLKKCIPNELWYKDYKICKNCIEKLDSAYDFVCMCIKNEKNRKEKYEKTKGPYLCNECSKEFKAEKALKRHITSKHTSQETIVEHNIETDIENKENKIEIPKYEEEYKESDTVINQSEGDATNALYLSVGANEAITENNSEPKIEDVKSETDLEITDVDFHNDCDLGKDEISSTDSEDYVPIAKLCKKRKYTKRKKAFLEESAEKKRKPEKKSKRGPYKCKYCDEIFKLTVMLKKHVLSAHATVRPFACDQCDATYKTSFALLIHKRVHTGERPYICTVCGKGFRASPDLIVHTKTHNPVRGYKCSQCEKSFKTASNLRRHRICVHTKPEDYEFQCSQCGRKFPFKDLLNHHIARHAGTRNFACHICENKFTVKNDLSRHLRLVHRNEQRSSCKECGKEFKTIFGLKKHMKTAHGLGAYKEAEKKLLCPYCPKMFPYNNKLQRHILTHTGERPFKCEICSKGFRDRFDLKTHLNNTHQISL